MKKIWLDISTNEEGKYSLKRLQVIFASFLCVFLSLPFVVELHIYPEQSFNLQPPPLELIYAWMAVAFGFAGLNVLGKQIGIDKDKKQ